MKKSQLRNIIRESIKQLITEQPTPVCVSISTCWRSRPASWQAAYEAGNPQFIAGGGTYNISNNAMGHTKKFLINGAIPQLGDVFMGPTGFTTGYGAWGIVQQQGALPMPPGYHMYQPCIVRIVHNHSNCGNWTINQVLSTGNAWNPPGHALPGGPHPACPAEPLPPTNLTFNGCTDSTALNFNSAAVIDDGSCEYGYKCESIWYIQTGKRDKNIGNQCIPGTQQNPGTHLTMQDCESNCDLQYIDPKSKTITPFTTDPQSMTKPDDEFGTVDIEPIRGEDDEIIRMQELADIK